MAKKRDPFKRAYYHYVTSAALILHLINIILNVVISNWWFVPFWTVLFITYLYPEQCIQYRTTYYRFRCIGKPYMRIAVANDTNGEIADIINNYEKLIPSGNFIKKSYDRYKNSTEVENRLIDSVDGCIYAEVMQKSFYHFDIWKDQITLSTVWFKNDAAVVAFKLRNMDEITIVDEENEHLFE